MQMKCDVHDFTSLTLQT